MTLPAIQADLCCYAKQQDNSANDSNNRDVYRRLAEEGWIGLTRPEGAGATFLEWTLWIEELAAASATVADVVLTADLLAYILGSSGGRAAGTARTAPGRGSARGLRAHGAECRL